MDTIGSLVDKLSVVNLKMWNAQEGLYEIRRMTLNDFKKKYFNEKGIEELFNSLNKAADLNVQRNNLIDEIDKTVLNLIDDSKNNEDLSKYFQKKHKTY